MLTQSTRSHAVERRALHLHLLAVGVLFGALLGACGYSDAQRPDAAAADAGAPDGGITDPPPSLAPGAGWDGTPGSGFGASVPLDPIRTTAKPVLHWWTVDQQAMTSDTAIGVDADALGGVASVEFFCEGNSLVVPAATVFVDTDANGAVRKRLGFWITLDVASALARNGTTGALNLYAKATPKDATFQPRVIGPLTVYPRSVASDFDKTIAPSGADFATIKAAMDAARAASAKRPRFTFTATAFYELENSSYPLGAAYAGDEGFVVLRAAPGVTATLGRSTAFDGNDPLSWGWIPAYDGLEFQGSGIVFDFGNWSFIWNNKPAYFNGCKLTNSIGGFNDNYWNKGPHPQFGVVRRVAGDGVPSWWVDTIMIEQGSPMNGALMAQGVKMNGGGGRTFFAIHFMANNYLDSPNIAHWFYGWDAMSVTYTGAAASASISITNHVLTVTEGGAAIESLALGLKPSDTYFDVAAVVAKINTHAGWSATLLDDRLAAYYLNGPNNLPDTSVLNTTTVVHANIDFHTEFFQSYTGGTPRENVIVRNNTVRNGFYTTAFLNIDAPLMDGIVKGNIFQGTPMMTGGGASSGQGFHVVVANNFFDGALVKFAGADQYNLWTQNVVWGFYPSGTWTTYPIATDNISVPPAGIGPLGGSSDTGNVSIADYAELKACFTDWTIGDFRPSGALLTNLRPPLDPYDARGNARASNDAIGPWAIGYDAPIDPFD
jgi:hypothetical protein